MKLIKVDKLLRDVQYCLELYKMYIKLFLQHIFGYIIYVMLNIKNFHGLYI